MTPAFEKFTDGLIPVVIQDKSTAKVLMLGYMNEEAYNATLSKRVITFFSRSKQRLWTKGESSGNFLHLSEIRIDCDNDCLLAKVDPEGPVCHTGADTCFDEKNQGDFLSVLEDIIARRKKDLTTNSYTASLFSKGINAIAQKVGEEAVELIIEAKDDNENRFLNEAADLVFHLLVLLKAKGKSLNDVRKVLEERHNTIQHK